MKKQLKADIAETQDTNQAKPDNRVSLFWVDKDQSEQMIKFADSHSHCQRGAIGGAITYCFSPTSLGVVMVVKCHCGAELDVTKYFDW
jgi:hypothetical protein